MDFFFKNKFVILGVLVGAVAGYLYYYFIGCSSGSCMISSQPINSTVYGAAMGGFVLKMFEKDDSEKE